MKSSTWSARRGFVPVIFALAAGCVPSAASNDETSDAMPGADGSAVMPLRDAAPIRGGDAEVPPDAATIAADAAAPEPDAAATLPDGAVTTPDSEVVAPDALIPAPDAAEIVPLPESAGPGTDADADGWSVEAGDCDDVRGEVHPGAREVLDALDNDCDGMADEADEAGGGVDRSVLTERVAPADYPFADRAQFPIGTGEAYTHCGHDDGWYVYTEFREPTPCGFARFAGDTIHLGEDWNGEGGGATDVGEAVHAVANGVVVLSGQWGGWGSVLVVRHDAAPGTAFRLPDGQQVETVFSLYGHVGDVAVVDDQPVLRGDVLARIGANCPNCSPHLHWEIIADLAAPFPGPGYFAADARGRVDPTDFVGLNQPLPAADLPAPSPCAGLISGDYCADNGPAGYNGAPTDLITCAQGEISAITPCLDGCSHQPAGFDDLCIVPMAPEVCDGVDNDGSGVIDDLGECWMGIKRYVDANGARCWGEDNVDNRPPRGCAGYVPEQFAFITARQPVPGTWPAVQCSLSTDHIIVEAGSADNDALVDTGYDCSVGLGRIFRPRSGPRGAAVTPNGHTCPLYRFRHDTPAGGAHFFTRGADAVGGMVCEPPSRGEIVTENECFAEVPPGCEP